MTEKKQQEELKAKAEKEKKELEEKMKAQAEREKHEQLINA